MNPCTLCNTNLADKKNSHIIPKFLGKPLFKNIKPRHSFQVDKAGKIKKIQDIPKHDFLMCSSCEKRLAIMETYFSNNLTAINDYINWSDKFEVKEIGSNKILNCLNLNPILFKLFWYSIIWRLSITSHALFKNFKLPEDVELAISSFLNKNLFHSYQNLLINLDGIESYPKYHLIAYKGAKYANRFCWNTYSISNV